jgi:autotransporter translocation and assembly factor TamB
MLKPHFMRFTCALILVLGGAFSLRAQRTTGEITGTVMDQSGAAVAGATISAVCPDTNQTRAVTSGSAGEYRLSDMAICIYKVSVSSQGFKTTVRNVTVTVAQETKADYPRRAALAGWRVPGREHQRPAHHHQQLYDRWHA